MTLARWQSALEQHQIAIYAVAVVAAAATGLTWPRSAALEHAITPALGVMLFATFLQVPVSQLRAALRPSRFLAALLLANFVAIPLVVLTLLPWLPPDPLVRLGVLLVLLTPCIDYVVTFAHAGRADASRLLAATPLLLIAQGLLLPIYLGVFLGSDAAGLIAWTPFVHAFVWLIVVPLVLAILVQRVAAATATRPSWVDGLSVFPVPSTAAVLFIVIAGMLPQLGPAVEHCLRVIPVYIVFAIMAPIVGWWVARLVRVPTEGGRAVAFSAATRNSLVVLPLALAVPGAIPVLPAVIVTQTLVELVFELLYVRVIARWGPPARAVATLGDPQGLP